MTKKNKIFTVLTMLTLFFLNVDFVHSQGAEDIPTMASVNALYEDAQYEEAVRGYERILSSGMNSETLYYNLGNAYYKCADYPHAIVNYRRVLLRNPAHRDAVYNLEVTRAHITDKIEINPPPFFTSLIYSISSGFSSDIWAVGSLMALGLLLVGFLGMFILNSIQWKRVALWGGIVALVCMFFSMKMASIRKEMIKNSRSAVVRTDRVEVYSAPDAERNVFILHAGAEVELIEESRYSNVNWSQIELSDGKIGWVQSSHLIKI